MKKNYLQSALWCLAFLVATLCCNGLTAQTLTTDALDYPPGSTVMITGAGFASGETVAVQVLHNPTGGDDSIAPDHQPWNVTADANGGISTSWYVPMDLDELGAALIANASGQTSGLTASAEFTDGPGCQSGSGIVSVTAVTGNCLAFTAATSSGPDNFEMAPGGTYTMTISGVTECSGNDITVFVQNSTSGNFCFNASNGGSGNNYTGTFIFPSSSCETSPISYKCGANQPCDNQNTFNARGPSGCVNAVHLRANTWSANCTSPVAIVCNTNPPCDPLSISCNATGLELGCNPTLPPAIGTLPTYTGTDVSLSHSDAAAISTSECGRSLTRTWTATDDCNNTATCSQTFTWSVSTPTTISADGPTSVCEGTCVTLSVNDPGADSFVWSGPDPDVDGSTDSSVTACVSGTYTVTRTNSCGCTTSSNVIQITINDKPSCNLDPIAEADLPVANTNGNQITATTSGGNANTYLWTLTSSDGSWYITNGGTSQTVTFHCGTFGSSAVFTFVVTAHYGNLSCPGDQCSISISPEAHEQCAYTQGFYGQSNGLTTCVGMPAPTAVNQALHTTNSGVYDGNPNPIVLGNPGNNKRLTIGATEAACVTCKLPAGSSAACLGAGPGTTGWTCATYTGGTLLKNGKFNNVLIGQTLTLAINARLFPGLLGLHLTTCTFTTYATSDCNPNTAQIVPNSQQTFTIPQSIINCLGSNPTTNKVANLLALANKALGGSPLACVSPSNQTATNAFLSDINAALTAVNEGFDRCRIISGFNIRMSDAGLTSSVTNSEFSFQYYPNPSNGKTNAIFVAPSDGKATIEVYNMNGQLVNTLFNENVGEGLGYNVEFNTSDWVDGVYFLRTTVGTSVALGKLVVLKQ